jgi:hypothetical protein
MMNLGQCPFLPSKPPLHRFFLVWNAPGSHVIRDFRALSRLADENTRGDREEFAVALN